jgi:uncharacterized protein
MKSKERNSAFARLLDRGLIIEVQVEGLKYNLFMRAQEEEILKNVLEQKSIKPRASIIAPLDNMLWDRKLIQELFDFEYRWEVYKPAAQRKYGYYVLPILYGNCFVARFEPVLDKENNKLVIKNWWWEPGVKVTAKMRKELQLSIQHFMDFTGAQSISNDLSIF